MKLRSMPRKCMPIINASEIVSDFQLIGVALLYKIYDIFPLPIVTTLDFFPCSKHDMPGSEVRSAFTHAAHETNEAESSSRFTNCRRCAVALSLCYRLFESSCVPHSATKSECPGRSNPSDTFKVLRADIRMVLSNSIIPNPTSCYGLQSNSKQHSSVLGCLSIFKHLDNHDDLTQDTQTFPE